MAKIWVLQHHPAEDLGRIAEALEASALAWQYVRTFAGQPVPADVKGAGGLIIMGGPMGVYEQERYPFIRDELRLIESALRENKPVLGVCLGSQLLASALGATVTKGPAKEIGWHQVRLAAAANEDRLFRGLPATFTAFHWHGDVFDLPKDAIALASSEMTACQAFRYGDKAYGLLFHAEVTAARIAKIAAAFASELEAEGINARRIIDQIDGHLPALENIGDTLYRRWAAPIQGT